jgi:4-amino-4-deoxy-L-arabinose transferase
VILARPLRLLGLFCLIFLLPLGWRALWIPDEPRYAEIAREMLESSNWVVPQMLGMPYFEKPVAGYWFTAASQSLFGHGVFASRLPGALATALSALLVGLLAQRLWQDTRLTGIAVLIYLSAALVAGLALYITLDPQLTFWLNLALFAFYVALTTSAPRGRLGAWTLLGAACGMAFLTKGFIAWLVPLLVAVPYMLWQRRLGELWRYGPLAVFVAVVVVAPWAWAVHRQAPDFWNFFFWHEHVRRFASEDAQHGRPFWFYLPVLILGCLPWSGLVLAALGRAWRQRGDTRVGLLLIWLAFPLAFFSLARGKLPPYVLVCFTPLALLAACGLAEQINHGRSGWFRANAGINAATAVVGLAALWFARRKGIYQNGDEAALWTGVAVCLAWLLVALLQWRRPLRYWELSALPLWLLWICLPVLLTQGLVDSKQPSLFIRTHRDSLSQADIVLSNDVGVAANLAWELGRADIDIYASQGELQYGLATPRGTGRFVPLEGIDAWIASARRHGSVVLLLRVDGPHDRELAALPPGEAKRDLRNKLVLVVYPGMSAP